MHERSVIRALAHHDVDKKGVWTAMVDVFFYYQAHHYPGVLCWQLVLYLIAIKLPYTSATLI